MSTEDGRPQPQAQTSDHTANTTPLSAPAATSSLPKYKTLEQVAAELQVRPRWLRDYAKGRIPYLKVGRSMRFDARALAALEDELRVMPPGPFKWPPYRNGAPLPKRGSGQPVMAKLEARIEEDRKQKIAARSKRGLPPHWTQLPNYRQRREEIKQRQRAKRSS